MPKDAKIMSTMWAMKKKTNGKLWGRLNAHGYEQMDGKCYYSDFITALVTNPNTICIVWTLMEMNPCWVAIVIDVEGAFLQGKFTNGEKMHIKVEKFYGSRKDVALMLNVPIYSTNRQHIVFIKHL